MDKIKSYKKTIAAVVTALITWATVVTQSPTIPITAAEWVAGAILVAGAFGVYQVSNEPS